MGRRILSLGFSQQYITRINSLIISRNIFSYFLLFLLQPCRLFQGYIFLIDGISSFYNYCGSGPVILIFSGIILIISSW